MNRIIEYVLGARVKPILKITFPLMLVPGKEPIQIVPIGNGRVMPTGSFLHPSLGATGDLCVLQEPPCMITDILSLGAQMSPSRMGAAPASCILSGTA